MNVVLIPAYEPDTALIQLVDQLYEDKFKIVVVDDGSGADYANIFSVVKEKADIVTLPKNCGKGAALKAGMAYIRDNIPECQGFITCDADGQHRPEDSRSRVRGNTFRYSQNGGSRRM
jgi:glycosyltransferase involved in cell wall biosynthesis